MLRDDPGAIPTIVSDDLVYVDHRWGGVAPTATGPHEFVDHLRAGTAAGFVRTDFEVLAVRGESLAVSRWTSVSDGGDATVHLALNEVDDDGLAVRSELFEAGDLATVVAVLDEWYLEGEGAAEAPTLRRHADFGRAYAARDWTAVAALFAADAVVTDHRALGQGWSTGDDFVASSRAVVELAPDVVHVASEFEARNAVVMTNAEAFGTTGDGNRYSWTYRMVVAWDCGRIARLELFDATDEQQARARFEELAASDPRTPTIDNDAVRRMERLLWVARFDFDRAPELFSPDVVWTDHRSVVAFPPLRGIEAIGAGYTSAFGAYDDVAMEPTAVRGERLALYAARMTTDAGWESVARLLVGLDGGGRIDVLVTFDEDDLLGAVEEMDRRDRELRGDEYPPAEGVFTRNSLAVSRGDLETMTYAPGYRAVDHSPAGMGDADSAGHVEQIEIMVGQVPGVVMLSARLFSSGRAVLAYMPIRGATEDGSEYVWELAVVEVVDDAGRIVEDHNFQIEQWDEARALFDERTVATARTTAPRSRVMENAATRSNARFRDVLATEGISALRTVMRDDYQYVDHRWGGVAPAATGPDAFLDHVRSARSAGFDETGFETLAIRGDRVSLARFEMRTEAGDVVGELAVNEVDADGLATRTEVFEIDDLARAVELLDQWYLEGEGVEPRGSIGRSRVLALLQRA